MISFEKIILRLHLYLFLTLPLCLSAQQTIEGSILHGGIERGYILYVPDSYEEGEAAPLILNFHGYTSNAEEQFYYSDFRPIADTAGFLVVHPQGTVDLLGNTHWNVGWGTSTVNDVGFTAALIDSISAQFTINPDRIYSTGMSNGGFMSYRLACDLSNRIAAIASVTGSMTINLPAACNAGHPMPVMEIHGTADNVVAYTGNSLFTSIPLVIDHWVTYNECDTTPAFADLQNADPNDGSTVQHYVYSGGNAGVAVEHFKVLNGGHTWPGTAFGGAGTNQDFNASKEIWRFFSAFDIYGRIQSSSEEVLPQTASWTVSPNPAREVIVLDSPSSTSNRYMITDMSGVIVLAGIHDDHRINISSLQPGMYIVQQDDQRGAARFVKTDW